MASITTVTGSYLGGAVSIDGSGFGATTGTLLFGDSLTGTVQEVTPSSWSATTISITTFAPTITLGSATSFQGWFAVIPDGASAGCRSSLYTFYPEVTSPTAIPNYEKVFVDVSATGYLNGGGSPVKLPVVSPFSRPVGTHGSYNPTYGYYYPANELVAFYSNVLMSKMRQIGKFTEAYMNKQGILFAARAPVM